MLCARQPALALLGLLRCGSWPRQPAARYLFACWSLHFFTEFGPNMTTFVMPSELYPVTMRATGHGISAGVGKLGAFIGVFLFPVLSDSLGLRGTLLLTAGVALLGFGLTLVLPEPAGRSLEDMPTGATGARAQPLVASRQQPTEDPASAV